jgi:Cys-tRNA(Pro)/Cys-tRNA(Cys) deacylase
MAKRAGIAFSLHHYDHDPQHGSYGREAFEKLDLSPEQVFKTLVLSLDTKGLAVGMVPVSKALDLKAMAKVLGMKKVTMAEARIVERTTGYVLGGVSPLGQKHLLPTVIDDSAQAFSSIFVSAGKRGLEIELDPQNLIVLLNAITAKISK